MKQRAFQSTFIYRVFITIAVAVIGFFVLWAIHYAIVYAYTWGTMDIDTVGTDWQVGPSIDVEMASSTNSHFAYCNINNFGIRYVSTTDGVAGTAEAIVDLNSTGCNTYHIIDLEMNGSQPEVMFYRTSGGIGITLAARDGGGTCAGSSVWSCYSVTSTASGAQSVEFEIDSSGDYHLAIFDPGKGVVYGNCTTSCTTASNWTWEIVDSSTPASTGRGLRMELDNSDVPVLAYFDSVANKVVYAKRESGDNDCSDSDWQCFDVDAGSNGATKLGLAINSAGTAAIAYNDDGTVSSTEGVLRYAIDDGGDTGCTDDPTNSFTCENADVIGSTGEARYIDLTFNGTNPLIAWYQFNSAIPAYGLRSSYKVEGSWSSDDVEVSENQNEGLFPNIEVSGGVVNIGFYRTNLREATVATSSIGLPNAAPSASIGTASQTSASVVTVTSTVSDSDNDETSLTVEYSTNGSSWSNATLGSVTSADGSVTTSSGSIAGIDTDVDGSDDLTIEWNIAADIPNTDDSTVYLRITPNDGTTDGSTATTAAFAVDTAGPSQPGALSVNTTSTASVDLNFGAQSTDSNFSEYKIFYKVGSSGVTTGDTAHTSTTDVNLVSISYGGASTTTISGLSVNTQYVANIFAFDTYNNVTSSASEVTFYTLANDPGAPTLSGQTSSTIDIAIDVNSNPAPTTYAIYNNTDGVYLDSAGAATSTAVYQTTSSWSGISAIGLTPNTSYTFKVKAKNGDGVETSFGGDSSALYTLPAQASQPTISSVSTSTLSIAFSGNSNPSGTVYTVYNETDASTFATTTATSSIGVTGLTPNKSYQFSIVAQHVSGGTDAATSTLSTATTTLPVAPTSLSATAASTSQIDLSWSSTNASGSVYDVRYSDNTFIATTTATSYSVAGLSENTGYTFKVRTQYVADEDTYSAYSGTASATTSLAAPTAPSTLTFSSVATSSLTLSWTDNSSNEDSFTIKYGTDGSTYGTTVTTTSANVTSTGVTSLTPNDTYYFIVLATNGTGTVTSSAANTTTNPNVPTSLSASADSTSQITVSWSANNNVSGTVFELFNVTASSSVATTTDTSYAVTGLTAGTSYTFKVRAQYAADTDAYTAYTDTVNATTNSASSSGEESEQSSGGIFTPALPAPVGTGRDTVRIGMGEQSQITFSDNSGTNVFMYIHSRAQFGIVPSTKDTAEMHSITIKKLDLVSTVVTLEIASDPQEVALSLNETKNVDLDNDGVDDVQVSFANIVLNQVELSVIPLVNTSSPVSSCPIALHQPYKIGSSPAVYYISEAHNADGTINPEVPCSKRPFASAKKYFTYFDSWDEVTTVPETTLTNIPADVLGFMPQGPKYDPQYGALVKVVTDPKVYLLLGGNKHWITSETVFTALNYSWNWIEDVASSLLTKYTNAGEITNTQFHPNYTLIKYENDSKVYRLEPDPSEPLLQVKRHIADEATFESLNFRWDRIVTIPDSEVYETGDVLSI